ncbi:hypothetical protein AnaeK_3939 [Anaeromyxobacter sp. K]|uniref:BREX system ATP-binding domain-containing protein n=1 Tax=Anaeromyxobacter sp. (strain K) TaxID=447217 RepID=UPI00017BE38C|nr:BREX system ATP-binding domain-containing protein [Anaeromyxobacter sp. K]ACG75146.1 hypothetical protein AnaeK_3939 [Anaeromyxobacter sp. K]
MERKRRIAGAILNVLGAQGPLKARDIAALLDGPDGVGRVERSEVNSLLYGELAGAVFCDPWFRWTLAPSPAAGAPDPPRGERGALLRAIMRLRSGLPPGELIRDVTVGFEQFGEPLLEVVSAEARRRWLWVRGNYGEGKSHALALARDLALAEGTAVCHLTADSTSAALNYPQRFLPVLLSTLEIPGQARRGLHEILDSELRDPEALQLVKSTVEDHLRRERVLDVETRRALARLAVLIEAGDAAHPDFDTAVQIVIANLCGRTIGHKAGPGARELVYTLLRLVRTFVSRLGCPGPVLLLDEVESVYTKLPNPQARMSARRVLSALCAAPALDGFRVVMSITPDALGALRGDVPAMGAETSSLDEEPVAEWASTIEDAPVVACRPLRGGERRELLVKVRTLYGRGYGEGHLSIPHDTMSAIARSDVPVRIMVRRAIDVLDTHRLNHAP